MYSLYTERLIEVLIRLPKFPHFLHTNHPIISPKMVVKEFPKSLEYRLFLLYLITLKEYKMIKIPTIASEATNTISAMIDLSSDAS